IADAGAVLIHDGESLHAPLLGAGLVDEDDAGVEIALLAGEPGIDLVGYDVSDAPVIVRPAEILLAGQLGAARHVPQPELDLHAAIRLARDPPGHQRLGLDGLPVRKARLDVGAGDPLDERGGIDRCEQAAAPQIVDDDLRDAARRLAIGWTAG